MSRKALPKALKFTYDHFESNIRLHTLSIGEEYEIWFI